MKRFLTISLLAALAGCAAVPGMDFLQRPVAPTPATPVFFQPFSAALDQPALTTISALAQEANNEPKARIYVTGAADGTGSSAANKDISKARAQVVADALVSDGVARGRIHLRSIGVVVSPSGPGAQAGRRALVQIGG